MFGTGTVTLNGGAVDTSFSGAGGQVLITSNATVWNGNFQVGTSGTGTGTWNNNGTVLLGASVAFSQLTSGVLNLSNVVSDGGSTRSLTVTNGTMSLSGANTYGGGTILTAGLLNINNSGSGGTSSAVGIGTLSLNGGTIDNTSAGLVTLSTNNLINTGGNVTFTGTQSLNLGTGAITLNSTRTFTINGGTLTLGGAIGVGAQGVVKGGVGTLALTSASSANTGANTINAGVLEVTKMSNGSAVSSLGNQTNAAANLIFGAQTAVLRYVGSGDTTDRSFTYSNVVGGGATIESSGSGALVFNGAIAIGLGATTNQTRLLTLGGTNTNTNTFGKVITDNGATGATSLTKSGASVWSLTSNNTYTGGTAIGGGTLNLGVGQSGTGGPLGGSGAVSTVGTITFSGGTLQYSASNTVDYSSRFGSGVNQFSIDTNAQTVVYATQIIAAANASTFTKLGTGTLTLSSAVSRYTGATTITGGTLSVASMANGGADSAIGKSSSAATSLERVLHF